MLDQRTMNVVAEEIQHTLDSFLTRDHYQFAPILYNERPHQFVVEFMNKMVDRLGTDDHIGVIVKYALCHPETDVGCWLYDLISSTCRHSN